MARRHIELFEHETLHVAADGLTSVEFDALVELNDASGRQYFDVGHRRLATKQYVGYIEVGGLGIEILPKADRASGERRMWREGLFEMLRVAYDLRLHSPGQASQRLHRFRLLELVAHAFLAELETLQRHGLARGYRADEGNGNVFRGRLKVAQHIRENVARADWFFVEHQAYDYDITVNRLLAQAISVLCECALGPSTLARAQRAGAVFPEVEALRIGPAVFERLRLGRSTVRYERALMFARMILEQAAPRLRGGDKRVFALMFDMNLLWERYVAALFRRAAGRGVVVNTQERHVFWRARGGEGRIVRPDIVVRSDGRADERRVLLVVDTKWRLPGDRGPSDEELKQMFVYNELLEGPRAILLYPSSSATPARGGAYERLPPHSCEQMFFGVGERGEWSTAEIQRQVFALLEQVGNPGHARA